MNQGRIWCVVHPTVGLPLLLGSVTTIAILVHYSVLSNTPWVKDYWSGKARTKTALTTTTAPAPVAASVQPGFAISVTPSSVEANGGSTFVVKVTPNVENVSTQAAIEPAADAPLAKLALSTPDSR